MSTQHGAGGAGPLDRSDTDAFGEGQPAPGEVEMLAAALRADAADVDAWSRVLTETLGDALPTGMVRVERERSIGDRMAGRAGRAVAVTVTGRNRSLELREHRSGIEARIVREVRGVVIARETVDLDGWLRALADEVATAARSSAASREALRAFLHD